MLTVRLNQLTLKPNDAILDLGCGQGRHALELWRHFDCKVTGLDLSDKDIETCRNKFELYLKPLAPKRSGNIDFVVGDAYNCPFPSESFDLIVCSEVLEHLHEYKVCLSEINRMLRPGGVFAMSVPRMWTEYICWKLSEHYANQPGGHVRIFSARKLRKEIEDLGLKHYKTHWAHGLHSPYWWLQCLLWETKDESKAVALYRRFLEWEILENPLTARVLESIAGPLMGKSVVMYFRKNA